MTRFLLSSAVVVSSSGVAFANGDHAGNGWYVILHMLSEPDHLAMLTVAIVAGVFAVRHYRRQA